MLPMGLNSTQFLTYGEIKTDRIDLFDDAFGFRHEFKLVFEALDIVKIRPRKEMIDKLLRKIRTENI